jgi:hypothetical protein
MVDMPRPSKHHEKLHFFAGTWIGEEQLSPSPWGPGGVALGRYIGRVDVDGFFLLQDYVEERDGRVVYRGHGVFGWDERDQTYTWYWVDSLGSAPSAPSRGRWVDDMLVFEHAPVGAQRGRYTYRITGEDSYHFTIENSEDGGQTYRLFLEADYHRQ